LVQFFLLASFLQLDADEYLIPLGNWSDVQSWLRESVANEMIGKDTHILSFFQTRAVPNYLFMEEYDDGSKDCAQAQNAKEAACLAKRRNVTFLQAYDCERTPLPKPDFGWRAKKQIYRPSVSLVCIIVVLSSQCEMGRFSCCLLLVYPVCLQSFRTLLNCNQTDP
jgi:hypothetical protein